MSGILDASCIADLHNSTIDTGANFLVGAATSSFDPSFSKESAGIMSVAGAAMNTASGATNIVGNTINTAGLSATIVAQGISYLSSSLTAYIATATVELLNMPYSYIGEVTASRMKEVIAEAAKNAQKAATQNQEDEQQKKDDENKEKKQNETLKKAQDKVKNASFVASNALNNAATTLNSIATYVSQGPDWMETQISTYTNKVMDGVYKFVGNTIESFNKEKHDFAYSVGYQAGEVAAKPAAQKTYKAAREAFTKIEQKKNQAIAKAKAATAQGIMKLKGLLGG